MTQTYTAPTPTEKVRCRGLRSHKFSQPARALVLAELMMVLVIIALFVSLASLNISGIVDKSKFKSQAQDLVDVMRMAVTSAAKTGRRYEVILDVTEQTYTLRKITSSDLSEILDDDIIHSGNFNDNCQLSYIQFDDFVETNENLEIAYFRTGRNGWQAGGKIVMFDSNGQEYSIIVNRLNRMIELKKGDVELLVPKENVFF